MVEDRVTDPRHVAQLLASEFTGLETGPLAEVAIVDASADASPAPSGTTAYALEYRSQRVGTVRLYPDYVAVSLAVDSPVRPAEMSLPVESIEDGIRIRVEDGVAVKRAVDIVRSTLGEKTG